MIDISTIEILSGVLNSFRTMQSSGYFSNSISIEEVFGQIICSGKISLRDRQLIRSALLEDSLTEEHQAIINRVLYNVRRGFLKLVD